jgi:hypothetical protein
LSDRPEKGGPARGQPQQILTDPTSSYDQLRIIERYEQFIDYLYPILQSCPRKHGIARDAVLAAMFAQVDLFIIAGKSRQASRLYSADANLSALRFWLRFLAAPSRKIITPNQHRVASIHLAEVGKMIGAWLKSAKSGG